MSVAFSLVLPEGGRVAVRRPTVIAAVVEARDTNASRASRGLGLCVLLHRPSGGTWDVAPTADAMALADRIGREVVEPAPMAAPKNPRGGRPARSGAPADASVKIRLTTEEHDRFSKAALASGFTMPRTKAEPEPRGAVGAWLRSLGLAATPNTPGGQDKQ